MWPAAIRRALCCGPKSLKSLFSAVIPQSFLIPPSIITLWLYGFLVRKHLLFHGSVLRLELLLIYRYLDRYGELLSLCLTIPVLLLPSRVDIIPQSLIFHQEGNYGLKSLHIRRQLLHPWKGGPVVPLMDDPQTGNIHPKPCHNASPGFC